MSDKSIVYTLCFVGGCMDCISFLLLFHTLLGLMTFNTMYGIIGLFNPESGIKIGFHLYLVLFFIITVFIMKLIHERAKLRKGISNFNYINIEVIFILVYALAGSYAFRNRLLFPDGWLACAIACIGMIPVYLQNYVITHSHRSQTGTVLMTGNYVSMIGSVIVWISSKNNAAENRETVIHYIKVHGSFCCGVMLMAVISRWVDFLGLLLPCTLLLIHNLRIRAAK